MTPLVNRLPVALVVAMAIVAGCGGTTVSPVPSAGPSIASSAPGSLTPSPSLPSPSPRLPSPPPATSWTPNLKVERLQPLGLLAADGSLWLAEHHSGSLVRLDPASGMVQATITGLGDEAQVPFEAVGQVWVPSGSELQAVDPKTNKIVRSIPGSFSFDGVEAAGRIWIDNGFDALLEIDPTNGSVLKTIPSNGLATGGEDCLNSVAAGDGVVWWSVNSLGAVLTVDPGSATVTGDVGHLADNYVAVGSDRIWAKGNDGLIRTIDPASRSVTATYPVNNPAPSNCVFGVAVDGSTVLIFDDTDGNHVYRLDAATGKVTGYFDPGDTDIQSMVVVDHSVWLTFYDSGYVDRYSPPSP